MSNTKPKVQALLKKLKTVHPGPIPEDDEIHVTQLLIDAWEELDGSSAENTTSDKVGGRIESLIWDDPILKFKIERHGRTMNGSSRASLHTWNINPELGTAVIAINGTRQLTPNAPRLNVKLLAEELKQIILSEGTDPRVTWDEEKTSAKVNLGIVIPTTNQQTTSARRKRFRDAMKDVMQNTGWKVIESHASFLIQLK